MPSIEIPNSARRDFDTVLNHLSNFGCWGTHPKKRFIIANWSFHTVVRIYPSDVSVTVKVSPQFVLLFVSGLIPILILAMGLIGLPDFQWIEFVIGPGVMATSVAVVSGISLEVAVGIGAGWLLWRLLLLSDTLERMTKLLLAPTPSHPHVIPVSLIQRTHLQQAHLGLITLCIFLEKIWWARARKGETDYRYSLDGSAWLSQQFGEVVEASLLGIVEASIVMWIFMTGLLLVRTVKRALCRSDVQHATDSGLGKPAAISRDRRAA